MSLVRWNPERNFFAAFSDLMDDWFDDNGNWLKPLAKGASVPATNVTENKKEYKLEIFAPGYKKEDFKLEVKNGYLSVSGENSSKKEDKDEKVTRREFQYHSFARSFALPENVKADAIDASYEDGLLKITLPKNKAEADKAAKQIAVK